MATYVNVTQQEIEEFLLPQGFEPIHFDGTRELVYAKRVDCDGQMLTIRVYTGIEPTGVSRDVGRDAMRAQLVFRTTKGEIRYLQSSKRVHRVAGWRANLQQRIDSLEPGPACSECSSPMVVRTGKRGSFYGCANYPTCNHTAPVAS